MDKQLIEQAVRARSDEINYYFKGVIDETFGELNKQGNETWFTARIAAIEKAIPATISHALSIVLSDLLD